MMPRSARLTSKSAADRSFKQDVLDVLTDVAGFGQRGGVGDGEGDVEHARERLGEEGLAAAGRTEEQHVRLGDLHVVLVQRSGLDALVVVVDRDGEDLLRLDLTDDELIEEGRDLARRRQVVEDELGAVTELVGDDVVAQVDALVADVHAGSRDELLDLFLTLRAEAALDEVVAFTKLRH